MGGSLQWGRTGLFLIYINDLEEDVVSSVSVCWWYEIVQASERYGGYSGNAGGFR